MEPLTTFTDKDVFVNDPPPPWKKIMYSRCSRLGEEEAWEATRAWSWSEMQRACPQGSFWTTFFWDLPGPLPSLWWWLQWLPPSPLPLACRLFLCECQYLWTDPWRERQHDWLALQDCSVLEGKQCSQNHDQLPLGEDIYTRPSGRSCHDNYDIHMAVTGCHKGQHLYWLFDNFHESS